jgi:O-antigen/teichoic acid export membrane protein
MEALLLGVLFSQIILIILLLHYLKNNNALKFKKIIRYTALNFWNIVTNGYGFFFMQMAGVIGWGCDLLIIANYLGSADVARYSVLQKLFLLVTQPILIYTMPLWGIYAGEHAKNNFSYIKIKLKKTLTISLLYSIFSGAFLILFGDKIIELWSNNLIEISRNIYMAYFLLTVSISVGMAFTVFMNGCGIIKPQVYASFMFMILSIALKIVAANYGLLYFIIATLFAYIISTPTLYFILFKENILAHIK